MAVAAPLALERVLGCNTRPVVLPAWACGMTCIGADSHARSAVDAGDGAGACFIMHDIGAAVGGSVAADTGKGIAVVVWM